MRRILAAAVVIAGLLLATSAPLAAEEELEGTTGGSASGSIEDGRPSAEVSSQQAGLPGGSNRPKAPVYSACLTLPVGAVDFGWGSWRPLADTSPSEGATGYRHCARLDGGDADGFYTYPPRPQADLLVAKAEKELVLEVPDVESSPPRGSVQLVGIPVWFWVTNSKDTSTTVSVPGLSATLTARPVATRIDIHGGTGPAKADNVTIDCDGPGTPYDPGKYRATDASECSHQFDWNDTFTIDATVDWELTWTATNGQTGTLPTVSRTTTFTLHLEEAQAVTD